MWTRPTDTRRGLELLSAIRTLFVKNDKGTAEVQDLRAPPRGRVWFRPKDAEDFELLELGRYPVLNPGDMIGIHPKDPIPVAPIGTQVVRVTNGEDPGDLDPMGRAVVYLVRPRKPFHERIYEPERVPAGTQVGWA